ncbi:hypothetical protein ONZ43_g5148 [Nemania bipapillata]|uniref:Uncharacterized protein n=1 Tax=Nemania bipapillata TaxID=110536 RepID=A0ACC2IE34_9PEZI|nr:hypothetical protein ONZ43_g5148 [Nemania bipapillata]
MRPWNIDEWGAFVSWFLFGHLLWILVGTTTFFSIVILSINTVVAQETLAEWVGDYLTESAGLTVIFESAIVPRWKDGVISFRNVFVSRRPGQVKSSVSKGSSSNAAAVAAAERGSDKEPPPVEEDDGNYTQFDVTLNTVNVTLSFVKWWNADPLGEPDAWKKHSRLRIDGLKIGHLNRGVEGPFGWIYEGNVDIVADVRFPHDDDDSITKVMSDFYDRLEEAVTSNRYLRILDGPTRRKEETINNEPAPIRDTPNVPDPAHDYPALFHDDISSTSSSPSSEEEPPRYLVMDLRIHLNDVKATVPVFTSDLSYVNQALVRPIVAYINTKRTYIPIGCRIVKRASDFDGAWTIYDCGLMDDTSAEVYTAFARDVEDQQSRVRRLKKVGFWTLSLAIHALFMGMAGNVV